MELTDYYEHGIARGIVRFAKTKPDWRLYGYGWMFRSLSDIERWKGDGVIARVEDAESANRLSGLDLPIIDVAGAYSRPHFRSVTNDDFLTGYQAALHLLGCGFSRFAFLGVSNTRWSELRRKGFEKALESRGNADLPAFERPLAWWEVGIGARGANPGAEGGTAFGEKFDAKGDNAGAGGDAAFRDWEGLSVFLSGLVRPTALFACNDTTGLRATELAGTLGLAVPESLAILGVDNEDILCELAAPSLSSIMLDCEAIGFQAASALDAVLEKGGLPELSSIAVPPKEVAERESTRTFACEDELVAKAVTFIRAHAHEGIDVSDVLGVVSASRRSLEMRFRSRLGHSLHEEILRAKLTWAKRLLKDSEETVEQIAEESGFGAPGRFHATFKAVEGLTPGEWRRRKP